MSRLTLLLAVTLLVVADAGAGTRQARTDRTSIRETAVSPEVLQQLQRPLAPDRLPLSAVAERIEPNPEITLPADAGGVPVPVDVLTPVDIAESAIEAGIDPAEVSSPFATGEAAPADVLFPADGDTALPPAALEPTFKLDTRLLQQRVGNLANARLIRGDGPNAMISAGSGEIDLHKGDVVVVPTLHPPTVTLQPDGGRLASSSTVLYLLDEANDLRELGLAYQASDLVWMEAEKRFIGTLLVGLVDRNDTTASVALTTAIPIQLLGDAGAVDPVQVDIVRIGNSFQPVTITTDGGTSPFKVRLVSQFDPNMPPAELKVRNPGLAISVAEHVPGLSVGSAAVTVTAIGAPLSEGQPVILELDHGWLSDYTPVADASGVARTRLWSAGLTPAKLSVAPGRYSAVARTINYDIPTAFFLATLLGSLAGSSIFVYLLSRKAPRSRRSYTRDWAAGVVIGFGATVMAYAGMRLPEWLPLPAALAGELAPFALGFICAAAGSALINAIVPAGPAATPAEATPG